MPWRGVCEPMDMSAPPNGPADTFAVRVEPLGAVLYVRAGETLMQAASRQGYYWPSICQGEARCGLCFIEVNAGMDNLGPLERHEAVAIELLLRPRPDQLPGRLRLACCVRPTGDAVVVKRGVRYNGTCPQEDQDRQVILQPPV